MSGRENLPPGAGSFFRTLVLMGSSLAAGCGGTAQDDSLGDWPDETGTGGTNPGSGGMSAGSSGGSPASGGSGGSGGDPIYVGAGGSGGVGVIDPGPFECPPETWDCEAQVPSCEYDAVYGYVLPEGCACDSSRPATPDECGEGQVRTCYWANQDSAGRPFSEPVAFSCECVEAPSEENDCYGACRAREVDPGLIECQFIDEENLDDILCGCALPVLR